MKYYRLLTKEEMSYIDELNLFKARHLAANDFRKLNDIRNECFNVKMRAGIGCSACARTLIQHIKHLYLYSEEQLKIQEDARVQERPKRELQRKTQRSRKQVDEGDKGSVPNASGTESTTPKQVATGGRKRRPRKSPQPSPTSQRVHNPKTGETGDDR